MLDFVLCEVLVIDVQCVRKVHGLADDDNVFVFLSRTETNEPHVFVAVSLSVLVWQRL